MALAPLLPGAIQSLKARLQGRRGPVAAAALPRAAPPVGQERASTRCRRRSSTGWRRPWSPRPPALALLLVPIAGVSPDWPARQRRARPGRAARARRASRWPLAAGTPASGFALMGASRDLTFAVFAEALLLLALLLAALPAGSTDLRRDERAAAGCGALERAGPLVRRPLAFALVVLVETGRQPIDNPDTHLELTMIHEGPLLEYAGRDLALLQWSGGGAPLGRAGARRRALPAPLGRLRRAARLRWRSASPRSASALAVIETAQAKMRILRVPGAARRRRACSPWSGSSAALAGGLA